MGLKAEIHQDHIYLYLDERYIGMISARGDYPSIEETPEKGMVRIQVQAPVFVVIRVSEVVSREVPE